MVDESRHTAGVKGSMGGTGNPEKASPAAIERYIKGIKFPATKEDILGQMKENDAPEDVLKIGGKFEKKEYHSVIDISKEVGKIEPGHK